MELYGIKFSKIELRHLARAWFAISLAFAILFGGLSFSAGFLVVLLVSGFTVGLGFLLHELAHKVVAQRYGAFAEFRAFDQMLILAIVMSFFGFILAAPGAVMISGHINREKNGRISAAGPLTNVALALMFFVLSLTTTSFGAVFAFGMLINSWLAVFNMIPFWHFDGAKILAWNKAAYGALLAAGLAVMFLSYS